MNYNVLKYMLKLLFATPYYFLNHLLNDTNLEIKSFLFLYINYVHLKYVYHLYNQLFHLENYLEIKDMFLLNILMV